MSLQRFKGGGADCSFWQCGEVIGGDTPALYFSPLFSDMWRPVAQTLLNSLFRIKKVLNLNAACPFVSSSRIPNGKVRGVLVSGTRARRGG